MLRQIAQYFGLKTNLLLLAPEEGLFSNRNIGQFCQMERDISVRPTFKGLPK